MYSGNCNSFLSPYPTPVWTFPHPNDSLLISRKSQSYRISDILGVPSSTISLCRVPDSRDSGALCHNQSALGPLQAFCTSKRVHRFVSDGVRLENDVERRPTKLKFGINAILSDDFGKKSQQKENRYHCSNSSCDCDSKPYPLFHRPGFPSPGIHLHPHHFTAQSGIDSLPGPYSILNDETGLNHHSKRKRSWSRAVFSNLQRKGLEKRFEVQKYVTKPDRRQLAAMLGLTDAQVKVWFQNRRMKWRHAQQSKEKDCGDEDDINENCAGSDMCDNFDDVISEDIKLEECSDKDS